MVNKKKRKKKKTYIGEYKLVLKDNSINLRIFEAVDNDLSRLERKLKEYLRLKFK